MSIENNEGTYLGIDLGTSNTVVSFFKNGKIEQVKFKRKNIIPSALYFENKDKVMFGDIALKKGSNDPAHLLTAFKRDMGSDRKYTLNFENDEDKIYNHYIIDTNIFIQDPDILNSIKLIDKIHLTFTVQSELGHRKKQDETRIAAEIACEKIKDISSQENIFFEKSKKILLPEDFTANAPNDDNDNRILSVALKVQQRDLNQNVRLITNDNGLISKAKMVKVDCLTLEDFRTLQNIGSDNKVHISQLIITPQEASLLFLEHIKRESEVFIKSNIKNAVITVPANFNQSQVELTKNAGLNAGFENIRIMKEPIAAGMAYALDREDNKKILVYDFGGGTFDATFLEVGSNTLDVLGVHGDSELGGEDITRIIEELIYDELEDTVELSLYGFEESELDKNSFENNKHVIKKMAEDAKLTLSDYEHTTIEIPSLINKNNELINFNMELTRAQFNDEIIDIRKKSLDIVKELIATSGFTATDIDMIVMAGGTSNIPSIYSSIEDTFGKSPLINKDTALVISQGAVIEAIQLWDESNTVQEQILYNDKALFDFGIGLKSHTFDILVPIHSSLPFRVEKIYVTEKDNQESLLIRAFQRREGYEESIKTHDKCFGFVDELVIYNLPPSTVGEFKIKVTFELTKDDTLDMSVLITDKDNNEIDSNDVKIKKVSQE
jgi:molecular chaperone DnaK